MGRPEGLGELVGAPAPRPAPVRALAVGVAVLLVLGLVAVVARDGGAADPVAVRSHGTGTEREVADEPLTLDLTEDTTTTTSDGSTTTLFRRPTTTVPRTIGLPGLPQLPNPAADAPPPPPPAPKVLRFDVPTEGSWPNSITVGADGNLWYGAGNRNIIGRITPTGSVTEFRTPDTYGQGGQLALGPDGNIWYAEYSGGDIGRITPAGVITEFTPLNASPFYGIAAGPDGAMWFTVPNHNIIGRIDMSGSTSQPIWDAVATMNIEPGPGGALWFAGNGGLRRIAPDNSVVPFSVPQQWWATGHLALGPDGAMWFSIGDGTSVVALGRMTVDGLFSHHPLGAKAETVSGMVGGPDGNLWVSDYNRGVITRVSPVGGVIEEIPIGGRPTDLVVGPDGNVWFTDPATDAVGRIKV